VCPGEVWRRGLPRYVERDFTRYLECGVLAHGFARVRCESCKDELLVAFSCKGRGVCPSCNAKRAHVTAVHLVERVLPHVLRAVFALQRRRARRQGLCGGQAGAVSFVQFFGSALQVTPHFHSLVPDGVFVPREGGVRFEALPPPTQAEVERLLRVVRHRVLRLLENRGALPAQGPEDAQQAYQAHSLQQRLRWLELDVLLPPNKQPRCSFLEGFSLHANTHLHANDRRGLERLCRYGARGALALERLSRAADSRIAWRMKRPLPDGTTHLFFTGLALLRRVASLVPGTLSSGARGPPRIRTLPGYQRKAVSDGGLDIRNDMSRSPLGVLVHEGDPAVRQRVADLPGNRCLTGRGTARDANDEG
jgi:hypothetical protein